MYNDYVAFETQHSGTNVMSFSKSPCFAGTRLYVAASCVTNELNNISIYYKSDSFQDFYFILYSTLLIQSASELNTRLNLLMILRAD